MPCTGVWTSSYDPVISALDAHWSHRKSISKTPTPRCHPRAIKSESQEEVVSGWPRPQSLLNTPSSDSNVRPRLRHLSTVLGIGRGLSGMESNGHNTFWVRKIILKIV